MRLSLWFAIFACALPLFGAGFGAPGVVVYPTTSMGGNDPSSGGNIALLIATKLTELGGITVKRTTPALALGADYYVTGFLSPVGLDNSLITQVVSTQSGSVVFSTTTSVRTYADAVAQADVIRMAILHHADRGLAAFDAPPTAPSTSPSPLAKNGNVNLTEALRKRAKPASTAITPAPALAPTEAPMSASAANATTGPTSALATRVHALLFAASGPLDEPRRPRHSASRGKATKAARLSSAAHDLERRCFWDRGSISKSRARVRSERNSISSRTIARATSSVAHTGPAMRRAPKVSRSLSIELPPPRARSSSKGSCPRRRRFARAISRRVSLRVTQSRSFARYDRYF